ncbi:MAG: hypothetical protein ACK5L5_12315 [Bacteroidales bacterium]
MEIQTNIYELPLHKVARVGDSRKEAQDKVISSFVKQINEQGEVSITAKDVTIRQFELHNDFLM